MSNIYLEEVTIPAYDSGNGEHFLIDTTAKWSSSNLNNLSYINFYIVPDVYSDSALSITASGTAEKRRTISLYDPSKPTDDTHPASLPDNEQASVVMSFSSGASYWTVDRLSDLDRDFAGYRIGFNDAASHNILNRLHHRGMVDGIIVRPYCDYNTIQNCYIHDASHDGRLSDAIGITIHNSGDNSCITRGTKIINNDIKNLGDSIQLTANPMVAGASYPGTIIDSNRCWIDGTIYTNGDYDQNGYNPAGEFMIAENAIDLKIGSSESENPMLVTNNIMWGYREQDPTVGQDNNGGAPFVTSAVVENTRIEGNIFFDSQLGVNTINLCGSGSTFKDNIIFDIGRYSPVDRSTWGILSTGWHNCASENHDVEYSNNSLIQNLGGAGYSTQAWTIYSEADGSIIKDNLFIDTIDVGGDTASQVVSNTWYYNHAEDRLGGTETVKATTDDSNMEDYIFDYEIFTASPQTKVLPSVITTTESLHYGVAGSTITNEISATRFLVYFDATGSIVQQETASEAVTVNEQHQMVWNADITLTANDITELEANPNLIVDIWSNESLALDSGYSKVNLGNFYLVNEGTGSVIADVSTNANNLSIGTGSWLNNQPTGMSNLLVDSVEPVSTTQAIGCKGLGDYIDTGIFINGSSDLSIGLSFKLDDSYDVDRYILSGGTLSNRIQIKQVGIRQIVLQVGEYKTPTLTMVDEPYSAIVFNYKSVDSTIQYAVMDGSLTSFEPAIFDDTINTNIMIGTDAENTVSTSFNNNIGIGYFKTSLLAEQEVQDFWTEVQDVYAHEFVVDGTFTHGISALTSIDSSVEASWHNSNSLELVYIDTVSTQASGGSFIAISGLVVGKTYEVKAEILDTNSTYSVVSVYYPGISTVVQLTEVGTLSHSFVAEHTDVVIGCYVNSYVDDYVIFDNISLKEQW